MTRALFERACRVLALVALATALWVSVRGATRSPSPPRAVSWSLADSLLVDTGVAWVSALRPLLERPATDTVSLPLALLPSATMRAALGAVNAAGIPVRWIDRTDAAGLALSVGRSAVPGSPITVRASANRDTIRGVVLRDAGGVLDSVVRAERTMSWQLASASAPLAVRQGGSTAQLPVPDSADHQRVLVVAQPGWEGKFVVAALEEAGWLVDGRMRVSPSGTVTVGAPQRLALDRYAVVVVLDSMAVDATSLQAFVARGGGVVLGSDALQIPSLASLRPARPTAARGALAGALLTDEPRRGLEAWELDIAPGAVVLQSDRSGHGHSEPALVARRSGRGRVVAMPYRETWRWRMQGADNGPAEHRRWWQHALAAAVPPAAPIIVSDGGRRDALPGAAAPYADLVARLGPPQPRDVAGGGPRSARGDDRTARSDILRGLSAPVLLLFTLVALLAEWSSRRLRGQR